MEILKAQFIMNEEVFHSGFSRLIRENKDMGRIDEYLELDLLKLKKTRDNFEHTKSVRKVIKDADCGNFDLVKKYHLSYYIELESEALSSILLSERLLHKTFLV